MHILSTGEVNGWVSVANLTQGRLPPPCEHWALPHLLESVFFYFKQYQQVLAEDCPVLPVLLGPLETGMLTIQYKSPSSEPECNVAVAGCVAPLLRELIFPFNLPFTFNPFSIPNSGLSPPFNHASGFESVFSLGLGYGTLGWGGPRCNSLFTKGAVEVEVLTAEMKPRATFGNWLS